MHHIDPGDNIPITASPAMYWNGEQWEIAGLCDACRQPFHGDAKQVTVRVSAGPMMYNNVKLSICSDQIPCHKAFIELVNINAKLRTQGR
jgi:hypothetical protein